MDICVVTVLTKIVETSYAYNQFSVWRYANKKEFKQITVIFNNDYPDSIKIPPGMPIVFVNRSIRKLRAAIRNIIKENKKEKIRTVFHVHNPRMALIFYIACAGLSCRKRTLFTVHTNFEKYNRKRKIFYSFVSALLSGYINCCSWSSYSNYFSCIKKLKGTRVSVIQNGVDTSHIDSIPGGVKQNKSSNGLLKSAFTGRAAQHKNHLFLLDVISECPDCGLLLIGPPNDKIMQRINELNLNDRVRFTGLVSRGEVYQHLMSCDIYISASRREGFPISVLEAMYCGLPVILSDIPAHKELTENAPDVKILPLDKDLWVKTLNELRKLPGDVLTNQGLRNRAAADQFYSLENMHTQYDSLYAGIAE